jgi:type II secretory ATPase GspE/PulE/Tfp pilus assembly ATPase PilB-like protein
MRQVPALIERAGPRELAQDAGAIVRIQQLIFAEAAALGASDIHIEPGRTTARVRYRVDGLLEETMQLPRWVHGSLVARIKVMAHLDITERKLPLDGHIDAEATGSDDARVSTAPTRWGEKVVIRVLKRARAAMSLAQLGFPRAVESKLVAWIHRSQGILFVVGPTGSGKTTTLYALVNEMRDEPLNIVTIEDPIEYEVEGITQIQVNEKHGLTFARVLRAILRQDPDVILVGEIRDAETAKIAVHAAMTGHLVLSTLHATDSVSALTRIHELGVERSSASSVILGIVAQRLVRLNCMKCAEPDHPPAAYLDCLGVAQHDLSLLRSSHGCPACRFSGARGRTGIYEALEMNEHIRDCYNQGDEQQIRRVARESGFVSLMDQAVAMSLCGDLSVAEAYRLTYFGGA